jgi:hypothetical protein
MAPLLVPSFIGRRQWEGHVLRRLIPRRWMLMHPISTLYSFFFHFSFSTFQHVVNGEEIPPQFEVQLDPQVSLA